jgi:hypothetical protein
MMQYLPFLDELLKVDACLLAEDEERLDDTNFTLSPER